MKVALVLPYNPLLERSGLQNLACRLASAMLAEGVDAQIVTLGPSGQREGVNIIGAASFRALLGELSNGWSLVHWLEVWPDWRVVLQHLVSHTNRERCGQVLTTETIGNLSTRGARLGTKWLCRRAYHAYVVSSSAYLEEYERMGIRRDAVWIVPHGLHSGEEFRPIAPSERLRLKSALGFDPKKSLLLYLGRLVDRKRPLDFVEAAYRLLARGDVQAAVVGDSSHHEDSVDARVRQRIRELGSSDLTWHPQTERPWEYFSVADVSVTPSERDGEAFTVLEAMACGAVPVVSKVPVLTAIVEGPPPAGLVFEVGNVDSLCASITRVIDDHDLRRRLQEAGFQAIKKRNLNAIVRSQLLPAYRKAVSNVGRS